MYEEFFGLTERPFSIAPDPQYLYMSKSHKEAMAHLSYGLTQGGGFIVLTGEVGTGKTTLCRTLLQDLPESTDVALILNATLDESELLQTLCDELKVSYQEGESQKRLTDLINERLLASFAKNRQTVLIIDEAQLLSRDVLEQIRLLTNLETTKTKLLKIILIGQPELNEVLRRKDLRQLAQRVTARYHLGALKDNDVEAYLNRRLSVAGSKQPVFTRQAIDQLRKATEGIPRRINVLADHSMLAAYAKSSRWVDAAMVRAAASEVLLPNSEDNVTILGRVFSRAKMRWWVFVGLVLLFNGLVWWALMVSAPQREAVMTAGLTQSETPHSADNNSEPQGFEPEYAVETANADDDLGDGTEALDESLEGSDDVSVIPESNAVTFNTTESGVAIVGDQTSDSPSDSISSQLSAPVTGKVMSSSVYLDDSPDIPDVALLQDVPKEVSIQSSELLASGDQSNQDKPDAPQQLMDILATSANMTTRSRAFQRLAGLWSVSFEEPTLDPYCRLLNDSGLACLDVSNWSELVVFNRPSIVVLSADETLHRAIVQSVVGQNVNLLIGEREILVDRATFESVWTGSAVALWRYNGFDDSVWGLGASGAKVLQAKQRLELTLQRLGLPTLEQPNSDRFDTDTAQKLVALQSRYGLTADGELGTQTKLLINEVLSNGVTPTLVNRFSSI